MLNLTLDQVLLALVVWVSSVYLVLYVGSKFETKALKSLAIHFWHTLFSLSYGLYVTTYGGDAFVYYERSLDYEFILKPGTHTVIAFTSFFSNLPGSSFLSVSLVFQTFGSIGLIAFDAAIREGRIQRPWFRLVCQCLVFLPSLSFWTSGIGKDSVAFLGIGLLSWYVAKNKFSLRYILPVIVILFLVRPHIAALMVVAFSLGTLMAKSGVKKKTRLTVGGISFIGVLILVPFALKYAGVGDTANPSDVVEYIEERQGENTHGGGGIDIRGMPVPILLLSYMYRPLPFEAHSVAALAASVDNMLLIILSLIAFNLLLRNRRGIFERDRALLFSFVYTFLSWLILASTTANLGIAMRQKWMIVPILVILLINLVGRIPSRAKFNQIKDGEF